MLQQTNKQTWCCQGCPYVSNKQTNKQTNKPDVAKVALESFQLLLELLLRSLFRFCLLLVDHVVLNRFEILYDWEKNTQFGLSANHVVLNISILVLLLVTTFKFAILADRKTHNLVSLSIMLSWRSYSAFSFCIAFWCFLIRFHLFERLLLMVLVYF